MKAFVANIFVLVSLISVANSKYCHEKNTNLNYAQFISKFDQKKNASKPNEDCAKQLERFQISLTYATGHADAFFEEKGDTKHRYRCDADLMSLVFWKCLDNTICYCPQSNSTHEMQCRQIMLTYNELDKSGTANDILKPTIQDIMQCKYPPEKKKEPKYPWPLLPPIRNLKNSGVFQGTQYLPYSLLYILGVIYIFIALSIVCDEYFVPALTRMCHKLQISDDVAGATLMAAGGSAPELFTSFIGTFQQDAVGFGTIVGSAVFNVLFVIGMCAFFSKEVLELTWWPLFRDTTYYCVCLLVLAILFGVASPFEIRWYESVILLALYGGYVLLMAYNQKIEKMIAKATKKCKKVDERVNPADDVESKNQDQIYELCEKDMSTEDTDTNTNTNTNEKKNRRGSIVVVVKAKMAKKTFLTPYTFRAGILQMGLGQQETPNKAGWYLVTQIEGNVEDTFKSVDTNGDNHIDRKEMRTLLRKLGHQPTEEEVNNVFNDIDTDQDGVINHDEFWEFYKKSSDRLLSEVKVAFDELDVNKNGALNKDELTKLLTDIGVTPLSKAEEMVQKLHEGDNVIDGIDQLQFTQWVKKQSFWKEKVKQHHEKLAEQDVADNDEAGLQLKWPKEKGVKAKILFVFTCPLLVMLYFTIPDTRKEYWKNYFFLSFLLSIVWIAIFSVLMVWFATVLGDILGISTDVMGLVFLSAGTSIPDLLSSVIVARQGLGNMAVSSSIGSNIFDILVGLPLPWLVYSIYRGVAATVSVEGCVRYLYAKGGRFLSPKDSDNIGVGAWLKLPNFECYLTAVFADTLFFSLLLLLSMIILVIFIIACFKWKMTKGLGVVMVVLYFIFLAQDLLRNETISPYTAKNVFGWTRF